MTKIIQKIDENKKYTECETCGRLTQGQYGYNELNYFSVTAQFGQIHSFCSDICAANKTGRTVI